MIDYEALAARLAAVKSAAEDAGVGIWRVLFDPTEDATHPASHAGAGRDRVVELQYADAVPAQIARFTGVRRGKDREDLSVD